MNTLVYRECRLDWPRVRFRYEALGRSWESGIELAGVDAVVGEPEVVESLAAHIGISMAFEYFQLADFDAVRIDALPLAEVTRAALERSFPRYLSEWRYVNGLDLRRPIRVIAGHAAGGVPSPATAPPGDEILLLNGGGKDTAVAAELLDALAEPYTLLTVTRGARPFPSQRAIARVSGRPAIHVRKFLPASELAAHGMHKRVPGVRLGYIAFLVAYLGGFHSIVSANEFSANFSNVVVDGVEINHQLGKSFARERLLDGYVARRLVTGIRYYSLVAPLYELQIARLFADSPRYLSAFVSCNVGQSRGRWCKACPKCAFIFLLLAGFLSHDALTGVFGENLFHRDEIRRWIVRLTQPGPQPLECVGPKDEAKLALHFALANPSFEGRLDDATRRTFRYCLQGFDVEAAREAIMGTIDRPHGIPEPLAGRLRAQLRDRLL